MAHRGRAIRKDLKPGGHVVGDAELTKDLRDMNSGRRCLGVRNEDRIGCEQCVAQAGGIVHRDRGIAGADRERSLDQSDIGYRGG